MIREIKPKEQIERNEGNIKEILRLSDVSGSSVRTEVVKGGSSILGYYYLMHVRIPHPAGINFEHIKKLKEEDMSFVKLESTKHELDMYLISPNKELDSMTHGYFSSIEDLLRGKPKVRGHLL